MKIIEKENRILEQQMCEEKVRTLLAQARKEAKEEVLEKIENLPPDIIMKIDNKEYISRESLSDLAEWVKENND